METRRRVVVERARCVALRMEGVSLFSLLLSSLLSYFPPPRFFSFFSSSFYSLRHSKKFRASERENPVLARADLHGEGKLRVRGRKHRGPRDKEDYSRWEPLGPNCYGNIPLTQPP